MVTEVVATEQVQTTTMEIEEEVQSMATECNILLVQAKQMRDRLLRKARHHKEVQRMTTEELQVQTMTRRCRTNMDTSRMRSGKGGKAAGEVKTLTNRKTPT